MTNSNEKGKRGERLLAKYLRDLGFDARRTQQYNGEGLSDVVIEDSGAHIEVKFGYPITRFDVCTQLFRDAVHQCESDSDGAQWFLFWKPHRYRDWRLTYPVDLFADAVGDEIITRVIPVTVVGDEHIRAILELGT